MVAYMTGVHREVKQLVEQDRARAAQLSGKPVSAKARALDAAATSGAALPAGAASSLFEEDEDFAEEEAGKAETEEDILAYGCKQTALRLARSLTPSASAESL